MRPDLRQLLEIDRVQESARETRPCRLRAASFRIFPLSRFIQRSAGIVEKNPVGRFLCVLWSRDYTEGRSLSGLRYTSARHVASRVIACVLSKLRTS